MAVSANRLELLQIADAVAREKVIDREIVLAAMADAIQKAARSRYGSESNIRADINPKTGEIRLQRLLEVVETAEDYSTQIPLELARDRNPDAKLGDFIADPLPPMDFGRIAAQSAKQVIVQKVREAERDRQFDEFKDRIGEIVNGTVKRVEYGNVIVDLGRGEGIIRRDEMIPRENMRYGDRVRSYVYDVRREQRGPQIFLSRTHPQFMVKLFTMEVPEIYDGIIQIRSVARDPGSRAKIAVISNDQFDRSGRRLRRYARFARSGRRRRTAGRKDRHHSVVARIRRTFIVNALQPAEVAKVVLDEDAERIEVVVPDEQLSLAIGRRGQNVRLASQLTGWDIDIMTEAEESERRQKEFNERTNLFMEALDVDEMVGQVLASEGFAAGRGTCLCRTRRNRLDRRFRRRHRKRTADTAPANISSAWKPKWTPSARSSVFPTNCATIDGMTAQMLVALGEDGIKTIEDFAGCAADDLVGWSERKDGETKKFEGLFSKLEVSRIEAERMVLQARLAAGWITQEDLAPRRRSARSRGRRGTGRLTGVADRDPGR